MGKPAKALFPCSVCGPGYEAIPGVDELPMTLSNFRNAVQYFTEERDSNFQILL